MKTDENHDRLGLAHWMRQVVVECEHARSDFSADNVHDLRVALRRCRSLAAVIERVDPYSGWKRMRRAAKTVFSALGELRDVQVMAVWLQRRVPQEDPVARATMEFLAGREVELKREAAVALAQFDQDQWSQWSDSLPGRAEPIAGNKLILEHFALEHWTRARELHARALRNRSRVGYHNLRIGIKKLRYMMENFLPDLHKDFGKHLKQLQDLLGEVHDLDVLWATAISVNKFPDDEARIRWRDLIDKERRERIDQYRANMIGKHSLWLVWRKRLPQGSEMERGSIERLKMWASFLDPEFQKSQRVSRLALQLYDGLVGRVKFKTTSHLPGRTLLQAAAMMRDVGRAKREKKHQKRSYKLIRKLDPPLGWQRKDLEIAALIARFHRGTLPISNDGSLSGITETQKRQTMMLAGILRLIDAVDGQLNGKVRSLEVEQTEELIRVWAKGNIEIQPSEKIAAARYLLETAYQRPVIVSIRPQAA